MRYKELAEVFTDEWGPDILIDYILAIEKKVNDPAFTEALIIALQQSDTLKER